MLLVLVNIVVTITFSQLLKVVLKNNLFFFFNYNWCSISLYHDIGFKNIILTASIQSYIFDGKMSSFFCSSTNKKKSGFSHSQIFQHHRNYSFLLYKVLSSCGPFFLLKNKIHKRTSRLV